MRTRKLIGVISGLVGATVSLAQQPEPKLAQPLDAPEKKIIKTPELAAQVRKLLEADYLTEEERKRKRVFHGAWKEEDLDTPQRRASAALIRGAYLDPSLSDMSVAIEDRAEALVRRGELEEAAAILAGVPSARGARIRGEALEGLGRSADAAAAIEPAITASEVPGAPIADIVEGVRARLIRARVSPQKEPAGGDFKRMESTLLDVSQRIDRLYWPAMLAEAELLLEKSNSRQAMEAAQQVLSLNPRCARAWAIIGRITVDQFNFEATEEIAAKLTELLESTDDGPISVDAAAILCRAQLRQKDSEGAGEALKAALAKFPKSRHLLALKAAVASLTYDEAKIREALEDYDRLSPGSGLALYEVGHALSEARQYDLAAGYLVRAAERVPNWSEPHADLGLMSLQSGRDAEGIASLKRAHELDPFNTRVENSLNLANELAKYKRLESDHFILRYAAGPDEVLAVDMLAQLESMYARVTGNGPGGIDHKPEGKTVIDLMPNQRWFAVRIAGVTRIHTMAASTGPTIAMEAPVEGPGHSIGTYDWLRVVRHEFTHTVTLSRTKNRIPHWFTEASAVYLEDSPRDYNTCQLLEGVLENDALFDFKEINIAFVRPKKRTDRQQAYAQGHWMYEYIVSRWGNRAPLDLMDRYAAGEREEDAMRTVLGIEQPVLLEDFKKWAAEQLKSWGMGTREPTVLELLEKEAKPDSKDEPKKEDEQLKPTLEMAKKWLAANPGHPDILSLMVKLTLEQNDGEPSEAMVPLFEQYAAARPVDPMPHKLMARLYTARKADEAWAAERAAKAVPHLEYLDEREQGSPAFAAELARAYQVLGKQKEAAEKAARACTIAPYDATLRELAATVAVSQGDFKTAERHIVALTILEPDRELHKRRLEAVRRKVEGR